LELIYACTDLESLYIGSYRRNAEHNGEREKSISTGGATTENGTTQIPSGAV
jgi:hypothetical protein